MFESAVVKVRRGEVKSMTHEESVCVNRFKVIHEHSIASISDKGSSSSYAEHALTVARLELVEMHVSILTCDLYSQNPTSASAYFRRLDMSSMTFEGAFCLLT